MQSRTLAGLLLLATLAVIYFTRALLLPVVLAFVLSLVFAPVVRGLVRLRLPRTLASGCVVAAVVALAGAGTYYFVEPAGDWLAQTPQNMQRIARKLGTLIKPMQDVSQATEQVTALTEAAAGQVETGVQEVTVKSPTLAERFVAGAGEALLTLISTVVLLYYLLAYGETFLRKVVIVVPRLADKKRAVEIARGIESEVSTYLFTIVMINAGLALVVGLAMLALGVPTPFLWGAMAGLFNFVPLLGDVASFAVLSVVGLLSFDEVWRGMLVPLTFGVLTAIEGYFVTPLVIGRRLSLNPLVIVLSLLFWGWMWGIPGVLLAVPILIVVKTVCDRVERLGNIAEFLAA